MPTRRRTMIRARAWWRRRGNYVWKDYGWIFVGLIAGLGLVLGTIGWHEWHRMSNQGRTPETWLSSFDTAFGLFTLSEIPSDPMPTALAWARFIAPLALGATLVSAATVIYRSISQRSKARWHRDHLLIVGCGLTGRAVALQALSAGDRCVVTDLTSGQSFGDELRELGIPILPLLLEGGGQAEIRHLGRALQAAGATRATEVLVATGDDNVNARVARVVEYLVTKDAGDGVVNTDWRGRRKVGPRGRRPPQIFVESSTLDLVYWLQDSLPRIGVDLIEWFNIKERGARDLLDEISEISPAISPGSVEPLVSPLLLVVGVTETAAAVAVQYCRNWACSMMLGVEIIPRLMFVDDRSPGDEAGRDLLARVLRDWGPDSSVSDGSRCEIAVVDQVDRASGESPSVAVVAVEDDVRSVGAVRLLQHHFPQLPIWLCSEDVSGVASFALAAEGERVIVRCMSDLALSIGRIRTGLSEDLARAMQGADYLARHTTGSGVRTDDPADRLWAHLDDESREKNRAAVDGWRTALDKIGLTVVRHRSTVTPYCLAWIERDFVAEHLHEAWRDVMDTRSLWNVKLIRVGEHAGGSDANEPIAANSDRKPWIQLPDKNRKWSLEQAERLDDYLRSFDYAIEETARRVEFVEQFAERYRDLYSRMVNATNPRAWCELDEWHRDEDRDSARALMVYLQRLGLHLAPAEGHDSAVAISQSEVEMLAPDEHRRWMDSKLRRGWSVGKRSNLLRTHPDMVPWEDLDDSAQEKDRMRIRLIPDLFEGFAIDGVVMALTRGKGSSLG